MIARTARPVAAKVSGSSLPRSWLKFLQRELERLREKLKDRSERIAELEKQVQEKEKELADAQKKIAEQEKQINDLVLISINTVTYYYGLLLPFLVCCDWEGTNCQGIVRMRSFSPNRNKENWSDAPTNIRYRILWSLAPR